MKKKIETLITKYRAEAKKARSRSHKLSDVAADDIAEPLEMAEEIAELDENPAQEH